MIADSYIKRDYVVENKNMNISMYILLFVVFIIGIILGSLYFRSIVMKDVSEYNELLDKIQVENNNDLSENVLNLIGKYSKSIILYWILGVSVVGSPFLILLCLYKGISNSVIMSLIISKLGFIQGNMFCIKMLIIPSILEVLALILVTVSSIKTSINVLKNKKDVKLEITRHTLFCFIAVLILIFAGMVEILSNIYLK